MKRLLTFIGFIAAGTTLALMAQTNTVPDNSGSSIKLGAFGSAQIYIDLGTLVIGTLLTAWVKKIKPSISKDVLPYLATGIAIVAGGVATMTVGDGLHGPLDVAKTVVLALANVTLRELKNRLIPEVEEQVKDVQVPKL